MGLVFAAAATAVSALVAAMIKGQLLTTTTSAILAGCATIATGLQASGALRGRAKHHYERVDRYRVCSRKAANLAAQVHSHTITLRTAYEELDRLADEAGKRPDMP